jgi:16S rRNA (adenine1518-N6/adenine1519-N6)-dimethyltransferase
MAMAFLAGWPGRCVPALFRTGVGDTRQSHFPSSRFLRVSHTPRKRFGQHFLADPDVVLAIVRAIAPQAGDAMVEIGPGLGAITGPLLAHLDHLHAVEIDRDVIATLRRRHEAKRLTVHEGDALAFDFGALAETCGGRMRVVGNLPYNISTPLLFHLAGFAERIIDCHFMLQKEVVERMVASPGGRDYGRLSVMLQYRFSMEHLFDVAPEAFDPPPRVDSAIVRMRPRPADERDAKDERLLGEIVTQAFGQRRKVLRNTLKGRADAAQMEAVGIDPAARAEAVPLAAFVALANLLAVVDR